MSEPKRHHFLPQRYLSGFSPDCTGQVWLWERSRQAIRSAHPPSTAVRRHFYRWDPPSNANSVKSLETNLARHIEGPFWPVLDKLDRREDLDGTERVRLAFFCAFMLARVPAFRASFRFQFSAAVARYPNLARDAPFLDGLFQRTASGLLIPTPSKNQALQKLIDIGVTLGSHFASLDTHFMFSEPDEPFITTDNPVALIRMVDTGQQKGMMVPGFMKWVPLSARTAVGFGEVGDMFTQTIVSPAKARRSNIALAAGATELVIASTEPQLRYVIAGLSVEPPRPGDFPVELPL